MGGTDEETTTIIKNEMQLEIDNETQNITKMINDTTTSIATKMVQETAATITIDTTAANKISTGSLVAMDGGEVNLDQSAKVKAQNEAIIKIITSADSMSKLGNELIAQINNKTDQSAAAKQSMDTLAKIKDSASNAGGPEGMVKEIATMAKDMMKSVAGGSSSSRTEITNTIKTKLKNKVINDNEVTSKVKSSIENSIKQATEAKCNMNTSGTNQLTADAIAAIGKGSKINVKQNVSVEAFNKCLIDLNIGGKIANELTGGIKFASTSETTQKAEADQGLKAKADLEKENIQKSAIMDSVDNAVNKGFGLASAYIYIVGAVILAVVIICGLILYKMFSGGVKINEDGVSIGADDDDMDGGGMRENKIYLFASLIAFLCYLYQQSIPLCGALLIIIILVIMNK